MLTKKQLILLSVVFMVFLPILTYTFNLPDTGQTKCYDLDGIEIPCAGTGQDGAYTLNPMSYTDNGNGTVTDNNTGLIWQKQDDGIAYNWYQASGTFDATYNPNSEDVCGALVLGGYSDWRLPTKKELISIVDYSIPYPGPTINTTYFPNTQSSYYWSSTTYTYLNSPSYAWSVLFGDGYVVYLNKYNNYDVRCVRGGQYLEQSFTDNGDGTVTDNKTGLVWQQSEGGTMTWDEALLICEGLSLGGYSDWRPPNIKELESLTDDTRDSPAINTTYFPNTTISSGYWSSTTNAAYLDYAWNVSFYNGSVYYYYKSYLNYVRCVQGGYTGSFDYYCDNDSDGYFDSFTDGTCTGNGCVPAGCQTTAGDDCNDSNPAINPGAAEIPNNGIDDDCNPDTFDRYMGDVNADGGVDIVDVILDLRCALELDPMSQCLQECGDMNGDGVIDIVDVILTLRAALGMDPLRECL